MLKQTYKRQYTHMTTIRKNTKQTQVTTKPNENNPMLTIFGLIGLIITVLNYMAQQPIS